MLDIAPIAAGTEPVAQIARFAPGRAVCSGSPVEGATIITPDAVSQTRYSSTTVSPPETADVRLSFAIDDGGRPYSIKRVENSSVSSISNGDLEPALTASRFARGAARTGCVMTYAVTLSPVAAASKDELYALATQGRSWWYAPGFRDAIQPINSSCKSGPGQFITLKNPDFDVISLPPGTRAWTFMTYDVDPAGRTTNVLIVGSTGNAALNAAGVAAVKANRFRKGPGHRGCIQYFYRNQPVERFSPDLPPGTPFDTRETPACRLDPQTLERLAAPSAFPTNFAHRHIEGIVALSYDTAPWGAIGNIKVLASEPAAGFGETSRQRLWSGKVAESDTGHRGCVVRVRYKLPPEGGASAPSDPDVPPLN